MLRALGLILVGVGLFVQTAAHASALPQEPSMVERNCNDMVMDTTDDEAERSPCADLRLDCLVALGCIPPLVMAQDLAAVQVPLAMATTTTLAPVAPLAAAAAAAAVAAAAVPCALQQQT